MEMGLEGDNNRELREGKRREESESRVYHEKSDSRFLIIYGLTRNGSH